MKRTKQLIIRVNNEEHQELLKRKTKYWLAEWMRKVCLNEPMRKPVKMVDPKLIFELAKIGGNLNQLVKKVHMMNKIEAITLLTELAMIRNQLDNMLALLKNNDSKNI